jgi:hypothetical protein
MQGFIFLLAFLAADPAEPEARRWGWLGHEMAAAAATSVLPQELPAFFRDAGEQLVYLNPEPDRWRERDLREMDQAFAYDHYIDLENLPPGALDAPDRFRYLKALYDAGLEQPERDGGFLPFRIIELYERLVTEWRLWRDTSDPARREFIEDRIVADAGILGHYVTDASQPHHTTIHFNGWAEGAPNPEGYLYDRNFHWRFESAFVGAHVSLDQVQDLVTQAPESVAGEARAAVMDHIRETHEQVQPLYRLDRDFGFDPDSPAQDEVSDFTAERLAAGARMLATLWWSAWNESASPAGGDE